MLFCFPGGSNGLCLVPNKVGCSCDCTIATSTKPNDMGGVMGTGAEGCGLAQLGDPLFPAFSSQHIGNYTSYSADHILCPSYSSCAGACKPWQFGEVSTKFYCRKCVGSVSTFLPITSTDSVEKHCLSFFCRQPHYLGFIPVLLFNPLHLFDMKVTEPKSQQLSRGLFKWLSNDSECIASLKVWQLWCYYFFWLAWRLWLQLKLNEMWDGYLSVKFNLVYMPEWNL